MNIQYNQSPDPPYLRNIIPIRNLVRSAIQDTSADQILTNLIKRLARKNILSAEDVFCICFSLENTPHFIQPTYTYDEIQSHPETFIPLNYVITSRDEPAHPPTNPPNNP